VGGRQFFWLPKKGELFFFCLERRCSSVDVSTFTCLDGRTDGWMEGRTATITILKSERAKKAKTVTLDDVLRRPPSSTLALPLARATCSHPTLAASVQYFSCTILEV